MVQLSSKSHPYTVKGFLPRPGFLRAVQRQLRSTPAIIHTYEALRSGRFRTADEVGVHARPLNSAFDIFAYRANRRANHPGCPHLPGCRNNAQPLSFSRQWIGGPGVVLVWSSRLRVRSSMQEAPTGGMKVISAQQTPAGVRHLEVCRGWRMA